MTTKRKSRVLVVDDTPENLRVMLSVLAPICEVLAAKDGVRALEMARGSDPPDLLLTDVVMPGMSGHELCEALRADPLTAPIPVLFVTGLIEFDEIEKGLCSGAVDYLQKPTHPLLIRARVKNYLELKRLRDQLNQSWPDGCP